MLSLLLMIIPTVTSSTAITNVDAEQSVQISKNGEFIAKNYPSRALKAREEGRVGFRLIVEPDGSLGSCEVTQSSGSKALDNETCEMIALHAKISPVRDEDGRTVRAVQNGYINWKLPKDAPKLASTSLMSKGRDPEKIICKKSAATGSLIKRTKQCMTGRQWSEQRRIAQEQAEGIIGVGHFEDDGSNSTCPVLSSPECR